MIRYKHPQLGTEVITTNDGLPEKPKRDRPGSVITTNDLDRDRKPIKKGDHDEKP